MITTGRIGLAWTDNADNEEGFIIEHKTEADETYVQIGMVDSDVTFFLDKDLPESTNCFYRVRSYNAVGTSTYSNEYSAKTKSSAGYSATEHTITGAFDGAVSVYATDVDSDGDVDVLGAATTESEYSTR